MLKSSSIPLAALCVSLMAGTVSAQTNNPTNEGTGWLQHAISLDRTTYFPGEQAIVTLTVRNPQRTPVEVAAPVAATIGCFDLSKLTGTGSFVSLYSRAACPFRLVEAASAKTVFGAGEERRVTMTGDTLWQNASPTASRAAIGYYQVAYRNSNTATVFRVVAPHLEAATVVRLQDIVYDDPATGRSVRLPAFLHVFSVRWNNQSFLCLAQSPSLKDKAIVADRNGNLTGIDVPYRRLAALPNPIASISATADAQDVLAIAWKDSTGAGQTILSANAAPPLPAVGFDVALDSTFQKVAPAGTQQFNASVAGSGNAAVRWSLALGPNAPSGARPGAVLANGRYIAPPEVAAPYAVIITAQSQADPSRYALGVVSLQPSGRAAIALPSDTGAAFAAKPAPPLTVSAAALHAGPLP